MDENRDDGEERKSVFAAWIGVRFLVFMVVLVGAVIIMEKCLSGS